MPPIHNFRNSEIKRMLIGVPDGHSHVRAVIETVDGDQIVFQEATLAAIVRGYTNVKTSPIIHAVELTSVELDGDARKEGYAKYQLVESGRDEATVRTEIDGILLQD